MKNTSKFLGIALVAVIGFAMIACPTPTSGGGDGGGTRGSDSGSGGPQKRTYVSVDSNGNRYTLEINESGGRLARSGAQPGDTFKLTVEYNTVVGGNNLAMRFEYSGTVGAAQTNGATVSLTLAINGETITITIVGTDMTVITGKIVNNNGEEIVNNPGTLTPNFTSLDEVSQYLLAHEGGTSTNNSIFLPLAFDLGTMTEAGSGWQNLLAIIATVGKFVDLDLSTCTMNGTVFDPVRTLATGKDKIVSLSLPNVAKSLPSPSSSGDINFSHFINLKAVSATELTNIAWSSFRGCTSLESAYFPAVTSIGSYAFMDLTCLKSVSFRASAYISFSEAFIGCTSLTSFNLTGTGPLSVLEGGKALVRNNTELVAYPSASGSIVMNTITSIDYNAFNGCTGLTSVSFPSVTAIRDSAFNGCTSLISAIFPSATSFGAWVFTNCTSLTSVSFRASAVARDIGMFATVAHCFFNCPNLTNFILTGTGYLSVIEGGKALVRNNTELVAYPSASGSIVMNTITKIGSLAFSHCPTVVNASFPAATSIGDSAFDECTSLKSVNIPAATSIGNNSFLVSSTIGYHPTTPLTITITLGATPPVVAASPWQNINLQIIVEFPAAAAAAYGPEPTNTTAQNWGNAFRGMGWDGTNYLQDSASPFCPQVTYRLL